MPQKEVKVKVATETELSDVEALEVTIDKLKKQRIQIAIDMASQKLDETRAKIEKLKQEKANLEVGVDDAKIYELDSKIRQLEADEIDLKIELESSKVEQAQSKVDKLDDTSIDLDVNNISAMEAIDQIGQGFDRLKAGAAEVGQQMSELLTAAGKQETNKAFLEHAVGAERAAKATEDINKAVQKLPGDDTVMQGLLSQAVAKDATITAGALNDMGVAAADYFSAMSFYGKSATEAQQDMTNYLLAGNTAELERSPILSSHIDKLKEGTTVQERAKLLQEALNEEHWGGMSQQDTYNNKLETFNGMLERGRYNLGGMFQEGAKGAMDFLMRLDEGTNGLVGMSIALAGFAAPITDVFMGIGQIGQGLKTLKEGSDLIGLTSKFNDLKDKLTGVKDTLTGIDFSGKFNSIKSAMNGLGERVIALRGRITGLRGSLSNLGSSAMSAASRMAGLAKSIGSSVLGAVRDAITGFARLAQSVLLAGLNALKSAAMWVVEKAALVASRAATLLMEAAQWLLNIAMNANPIMLIVTAIMVLIMVLGYLYFNNEQVRAAIDGLGQAFMMVGQIIYSFFIMQIQMLVMVLQAAWNFISTLPDTLLQVMTNIAATVINGVTNMLAFIASIPGRVGAYLSSVISRAISFASNFVTQLWNAGKNALTRFIDNIKQIPVRLGQELSNALNKVNEWAATLPAKFWEAGVNAVKNFLSALGIASPGTMQRMLVWEVTEMGRRVPVEAKKLLSNVSRLGSDIVDKFGDPKLGVSYDTLNEDIGSHQQLLQKGRNGDVIINVYGDVDSDKRIQQIVDAVTRELSWNNETAGRTV